MSVQSKELTYFYREYNKWLQNGAPNEAPFCREEGLCFSLNTLMGYKESILAEVELRNQFRVNCLHYLFPFGEENFYMRTDNSTQHLDPLRIKWVEDHLKPEFTGEN